MESKSTPVTSFKTNRKYYVGKYEKRLTGPFRSRQISLRRWSLHRHRWFHRRGWHRWRWGRRRRRWRRKTRFVHAHWTSRVLELLRLLLRWLLLLLTRLFRIVEQMRWHVTNFVSQHVLLHVSLLTKVTRFFQKYQTLFCYYFIRFLCSFDIPYVRQTSLPLKFARNSRDFAIDPNLFRFIVDFQ